MQTQQNKTKQNKRNTPEQQNGQQKLSPRKTGKILPLQKNPPSTTANFQRTIQL
ncbi:hypothetical protein [Herbaspirillum seropedicae]|uniref:hypothetical protein n=1 Tax=Herbaspirillum seropedicae TaxID=964 RepID=UPI002859FD13|nr:hypothetical protein [Herbaspirillum seropedicae]MDR6397362.1 hypothetical protein [Herbaspirillum seropedicae]